MATATTETLERVVRAYSARHRLTDAQRQGLEAWLSRATAEVPGRVSPAITAGVLEWERERDEELARLRAEVERLRAAPQQAPAREEVAATEEAAQQAATSATDQEAGAEEETVESPAASDGQATPEPGADEERRRTPRWLRR